MTLPDERTRALLAAEALLLTLGNDRSARYSDWARRVLRHYPTRFDVAQAADRAPDVFAPPAEPERHA